MLERTDGSFEPEQHSEQSGLAAPRGADDRNRFTRAQVEARARPARSCSEPPEQKRCRRRSCARRNTRKRSVDGIGCQQGLERIERNVATRAPGTRVTQVAQGPIRHETHGGERHESSVAEGDTAALSERDGSH